jgi:hypothetical protein
MAKWRIIDNFTPVQYRSMEDRMLRDMTVKVEQTLAG